jgi:putative hemolysin
MDSAIAELSIILGLIVLNGVFAMAEMAVVAARTVRLQALADDGRRGAKDVLAIKEKPDRFLSSVQVGITLVGIGAGAYGGARVSGSVAQWLEQIPALKPWAGQLAFAAVVIVITFLSLVIGELVPKQIALRQPENIASWIARPMSWLSWIAAPLVWLLSTTSNLILRIFGITPRPEAPVTSEEIAIVLEQGAQAGVLDAGEHTLIERVLRMGERRVSTLMTPRTDVVWVDLREPIGESMRRMGEARHTYFPVCEGSPDHVLGFVSVKDQMARLMRKAPPDIRAELRPPVFVPEMSDALSVLKTLQERNQHVALVVDEYGGVSGLVTLHDLVQGIVGELPTAHSHLEGPMIVARGDGSWLVDGRLPFEDFREQVNLPEAEEPAVGFDTVAGFVLTQLGRLPAIGDKFEWEGWQFEVVDMDGNRIDRLLITSPAPEAGAAERGEGGEKFTRAEADGDA